MSKKCNRLFGQGILVTAFLGILFSFIVFAVSLVSLSEHMKIGPNRLSTTLGFASKLSFLQKSP